MDDQLSPIATDGYLLTCDKHPELAFEQLEDALEHLVVHHPGGWATPRQHARYANRGPARF